MRIEKDDRHAQDSRRLPSIQELREFMSSHTTLGMAEALVGVAIVTAVGFAIPGHWGLLDIQPHPLWIVVIAIALRYGAPSGYIVGTMAASSYAFFLSSTPWFYWHLPLAHQLVQPFFLLAGGIVVGELTRSRDRGLTALQQQYQSARDELHVRAADQQSLAAMNSELTKRIMIHSSSVLTLYEVAKKLHVLHVEAIYPAVLEVVANVLEAESCALYLWREGQLELELGSPESWPGRQEVWSTMTGVLGRSFREGRIVTIRDRLVEEGAPPIADESTMMAGPLTDSGGRPIGVVAVERLPLVKLDAAGIQLFQLLLEWSSGALVNAREHEGVLRKAMISTALGVQTMGGSTMAIIASRTASGDRVPDLLCAEQRDGEPNGYHAQV